MLRYFAESPENACRFLFRQQIDLQVEVISPLRLAIHRILTDQDEGRQQHRFKGQDCGQKRKWIGIERPYCEGIPEEPQQDKDRLNDHEINRATNQPTLWETR